MQGIDALTRSDKDFELLVIFGAGPRRGGAALRQTPVNGLLRAPPVAAQAATFRTVSYVADDGDIATACDHFSLNCSTPAPQSASTQHAAHICAAF